MRVCELTLKRWPHKHLVVTVSPVALHRTFTAAVEGDGRHIPRSFIDEIVTTFLDQFGSQTLHRLLAEQAPPAYGARPAHLPIPQ